MKMDGFMLCVGVSYRMGYEWSECVGIKVICK